MDRRSIFRASLAALAVAPLFGRKAGAATEKKQHKLAIHVDQNDPAVMRLALGNTRNAYELYASMGEDIAIEIVCYSQGLHMLRDDTSPVKEEIRTTRAKVPQLAFGACNNTKRAMRGPKARPSRSSRKRWWFRPAWCGWWNCKSRALSISSRDAP